LALWDLEKYSLIKIVTNIHESSVVNAKIFKIGNDDSVFAISAEDKGCVQVIDFVRKSFLGYSFSQ